MSTSNINPNINASGVNLPSSIRSRRRKKRRIPKTPGSASVSASSSTTTTTTTCKLSSSRKSLKIISEDNEFRFGIQKASSLDFGTPKSEVSEQSLESNHDDSFVFDHVSPKVLSYPSSRHARQQLKQKRRSVKTDTDADRLSSVFTFDDDDDDDNKTFMEAEVVSAGKKAKKPSSMLEPFSPLGSFPMTPSPVPTSKTDSTNRLKDSFHKNDSKSKSQPKPYKQRPKTKTMAQNDDNQSSFDYLPEKVSSLVYSTKNARRAPGQAPSVQNSALKISNTNNNINNRKLTGSRSCYGARNNNNTVTKKRRSSKDLSPQDTTPSPSPSTSKHLQNNNGLSSSPSFGLFSASQESDGIIEEIKGISTDVYAVQDAGSYRQTCEHCLYLCSTISSVIDHSQNSTSQSHQQGIFSPLKNRRSHTISACTTLSSPHQSPAILKRHSSISSPVPTSSTRRRRRRLGFDDVNEVSVGKHTNITANSACELAYMLSKKQERSNLLSSTMNNTTSTSTGTNATIHCILEALASAPDPHKTTVYGREVVGTNKRQEQEIQHDESLEEKSPLFARKDDKLFSSSPKKVSAMMDFDTEQQQDQDENSMTISTPKKKNSSKKKSLTLLRTKSSRIKKQPTNNNKSDVEEGNIATNNKNLKSSNNKDHTTTQPQTTSSSPHDKNQDDSSSLLEYDNDYRASLALSAITHFISLECCTSRNSSTHKSNSSKRTSSIIRNCVLNHHDALLGISRLILYDTFMHLPSAIHEEEQNKKEETNRKEEKKEKVQGSKNSSTNSDNADNQTSTQSKKRSLDNNISSEAEEEEEEIDSNISDSIGAGDPTARGRRKRKNRRLDQVYGKKPNTTTSSLSAIQELQQVTDSLEKEKQAETRKKKESALTSPTNSGIYAVVKNGKVARLSFGTSTTTSTAIPIPSSKKNLETPKHQTKPYQKKLSPAVQKLTHAFTRIQSSYPSHKNSKKNKYGGGASFLSPESSLSNFSITSSSLYSKNSTSSIGNKQQEPCQFCNSLALKTTLNLSSDEEKIPEFLAMNAIKRIITRKEDSGEEGDDDDSPEEEDQHSSNNQVEDEFDFLPEQSHDNTTTGAEQEASHQDQIASNPFFVNTCLRESGALIILANAMVHTMSCTAETIASHNNNNNNSKTKMRTNSNYCDVCLQNLLKRTKTLASILDEACCLTPQNSDMIVRETLLVETLVTTIQVISQNQNSSRMILSRQESLEEILLCCLKMLTSITHENSFAGDKVLREANESNKNKAAQNHSFISSLPSFFSTSNFYYPSSRVTGFSIIFDVLYETVRRKQFMQKEKNSDDQDDEDDFIVDNTSTATAAYINTEKRMYDTIIFCLNSLTNVCECNELLSDAQKQIMSKKVLYVNEFEMHDEEPALVWLAKWLVSETKSYRDAILNAMPSTPSKNDEEIDDGEGEKKNGNKDTSSRKKKKKKVMEERDLSKQEQESLVIAGNGFVLLVCLMKISSSKSPLSSFSSFQPLSSSSSRSNFGNSHCNQKDEKDFVTKIRQSVLSQMPKITAVENTADENEVDKKGVASSTDGGISFMIRVLKAFLNFYHYSIGDLSVAVVEPVLKLVEELKNM